MQQVGVVTGVCVDKVVVGQVDDDKYDTGGCSDRCLCGLGGGWTGGQRQI